MLYHVKLGTDVQLYAYYTFNFQRPRSISGRAQAQALNMRTLRLHIRFIRNLIIT